jgi:hypothetical protein
LVIVAMLATLAAPAWPADPSQFSDAEKRLFVDDHLAKLPARATIDYAYSRRGSLEASIDDSARVTVGAPDASGGRPVKVDYLKGTNRFELPDIGSAHGNPILLYFLERELQQMHRLTGGSTNYYRKRIRMALADGGDVETVTVNTSVGRVSATRIRIAPYRDDPARSRYERFAEKRYTFTLSDAVPGKIVELRSELGGTAAASGSAEPIIVETLRLTSTR